MKNSTTEEKQLAALDSLQVAAKVLAKDPSISAMYPHIYWWDLERYLKLVRRGAIFRVEKRSSGGLKLVWDLPKQAPK